MPDAGSGASSRASKVIGASLEEVYAAFVDPLALVEWLPPGGMTGVMHSFDARVGGGYRMSLLYPPDEGSAPGKTSGNEDMVDVRFVELEPPTRIVEAIRFVSAEAEFHGEMTLTATFEEAPGGTEVTLAFENIPPGVSPQDNEEGSRLSLEQLARRFS